MPFASTSQIVFGDGADEGSSTEVGTLSTPDGVNLDLTGLGAGTVGQFVAVDLKDRIAQAKALVLANPDIGFTLDVTDDPAVAADPTQLTYTEAVTGGTPTVAFYTLKDGGVIKNLLPDTLEGLELAITGLGF